MNKTIIVEKFSEQLLVITQSEHNINSENNNYINFPQKHFSDINSSFYKKYFLADKITIF